MTLRADMQVREIATAYPVSLRKFEQWGIDYCCGGGRPLAEACRRAGVSVDDAIATIEGLIARETAPLPDLRVVPIPDVVEHLLTTHHEFTRAELLRGAALAEKVWRVHGREHPELGQVFGVLTTLSAELLSHMRKEELVLFPYILALTEEESVDLSIGTVAAPIACMRHEHEEASELLADLRRLTHDYQLPAAACGSYRALFECLRALEEDLHEHMHLENDVLFPRALELEMAKSAH